MFVPGPARDTAVKAFGQAVALMPGFSDLSARFGLQTAPGSASPAAAAMPGVRTPGVAAHVGREETQPAWFARADPRFERRGALPRQTGSDASMHSQEQGEWHVAASATASPRPSVMARGSTVLPPTDNRYAELTTPPQQLHPLTGRFTCCANALACTTVGSPIKS